MQFENIFFGQIFLDNWLIYSFYNNFILQGIWETEFEVSHSNLSGCNCSAIASREYPGHEREWERERKSVREKEAEWERNSKWKCELNATNEAKKIETFKTGQIIALRPYWEMDRRNEAIAAMWMPLDTVKHGKLFAQWKWQRVQLRHSKRQLNDHYERHTKWRLTALPLNFFFFLFSVFC